MLSVLAVIGKVIGFTLLGILGLLILIVLIVLFVPIRYRLDGKGGKYKDGINVNASAKISWLLRIVYGRAAVKMGPHAAEEAAANGESAEIGTAKASPEACDMSADESTGEAGDESPDEKNKPEIDLAVRLFGIKIFPKGNKKKSKDKAEEEGSAGDDAGDEAAADKESETPEYASAATRETAAEELVTEELKTEETIEEAAAEAGFDGADYDGEPGEKASLIEKLVSFKEKAEKGVEKAENIWDFITANSTQEELAIICERLKTCFKHYIPSRAEGYVRLGLSDPAATGKIAGIYYSAVYPHVGDSFRLIAEFDEEVIDGELHIKGRIRPVHLASFAIKMLLDKRFRSLIKKAKSLKEENK